MIREGHIRLATEDAVRRLAKYVGIDNWNVVPKLVLMDELIFKGIVTPDRRRYGWYQ